MQTNEEIKKQKRIIIGLSAICIMLIGGFIYFALNNMPNENISSTTKENVVINDKDTPKVNATNAPTQKDNSGIMYNNPNSSTKNTKPNQSMNANIVFPGFATITYQFTDKSQTLSLMNPKTNTVNFVYTIYDTSNNKLIYTSDKISPNQNYEWNIQDYFSSGTHKIKIHISTSDVKTGTAKNGIDQYFAFEI